MIRRVLTMVAGGWALVACTNSPAPEPTPEPAEPTEQPATQVPAPEPADPPPVDSVPLPPQGPTELDVIGLSPAGAHELLGKPDLVRWEGPAQLHQFRLPDCVLDLVFYEPVENGGFVSSYVTARDFGGNDANVDDCLAPLGSIDALGAPEDGSDDNP